MKSLNVIDENARLSALTAQERISWAVNEMGVGAVMLSSMQRTAGVLMHMFHELALENDILFVDTGFHFHETLEMRDLYMRKYKLNVVTLYPELTPQQQEDKHKEKLWKFADGQHVCCKLRKEDPFLKYIQSKNCTLVMTGLMQSEGGQRSGVKALGRDPRINGYSLRPLYDWTAEMVANYLKEHNIPIHPLHAQKYPSIGCQTCTTPVEEGEDPRAGRWRHLREPGDDGVQYCGINFSDGSGI